MTRKPLEWQFFDSDAATDWPPQTLSKQFAKEDVGRDGTGTLRSSLKMRYLYELICTIALLHGVIVYLLWQQTEKRIEVVESELALLRAQMTTLQQNDAADPVLTVDGNNSGLLETTYLRFVATSEMLDSVKRIASSVDARYQQLHRELNLSLPAAGEKLNISVIPVFHTGDPVRRAYQPNIEEQLVIVYPQSTAKQYGISQDEALSAELLVRLSQRLFEQAVSNRSIKSQWQGMVVALKTHIQVMYGAKRNRQWDDRLLLHRYSAQSLSLAFVHDVIHAPEGTSEVWSQASPTAYATANPLVEFIFMTYGTDKVSALLDAFTEHDTWETLTPALFHLSAEEFEAQWHAYLRQQYPIPG
ncbi:MAG: hypothetical protein KDE58_16730 [Caldilineaceae bacterium]|nr:hypothetical protein [Caldilineaceae bacterium]